METESYFENAYTKMWIKDGILFVTYTPLLHVTLDVAKICVNERLILSAGKTLPMFADARNIASFDFDARRYLSKGEAVKGISAGAFIIKTQIEKFLGNAFFKLNKPLVPGRLFTDEEEALKWLENYKNSKLN